MVTGQRLLVAEDEHHIAKNLARDLRTAGMDVAGPAPSMSDALALMEAGPLDGAVLDIDLRGGMAFPIADAPAERGIPFVFATGCSANAMPARYAAVKRTCLALTVEANRARDGSGQGSPCSARGEPWRRDDLAHLS